MTRQKPGKPRLIEDKDLDQASGGVIYKIKMVEPAVSPADRTPGKIKSSP